MCGYVDHRAPTGSIDKLRPQLDATLRAPATAGSVAPTFNEYTMTDPLGIPLAEDTRRHFRLRHHPFAHCDARASGLPPATEAAAQLEGLLSVGHDASRVPVLWHPDRRVRATVSRQLADGLGALGHTVVSLNTGGDDGASLTRWLLERLGLGDIAGDQVDQHNILRVFLVNEHVQHRTPVLLVHDPDRWSPGALELLLGIARLSHGHHPAVRLILLGRSGIGDRLQHSPLQTLASRLAAPTEILTVRPTEFAAWLQQCAYAGHDCRLFTAGALAALHRLSGGDVRIAAELACAALDEAARQQQAVVDPATVARLVSLVSVSPGTARAVRAQHDPPVRSAPMPAASAAARRAGAIDLSFDGAPPLRMMLTRPRCIVGRHEQADLRLDDHRVSRFHAIFLFDAPRLWIADLGGVNGTMVNGTAVRRRRLRDGDVVRIGLYTLRVHWPADAVATMTHASPDQDTGVMRTLEPDLEPVHDGTDD